MFIIKKGSVMQRIHVSAVLIVSILAFSGCAGKKKPAPAPVKKVVEEPAEVTEPVKHLSVNALDTIIPRRSEEVIMRGVMIPYEAHGVMFDSQFIYLVVKEAQWISGSSTRIRSKKRLLGGLNR